ncbi:MAG: FkbM family methyltransferase [Cyclobacteriaceae bacterium]|nr:FkbM family methyltransferase [Cyclobacteriaceae bacterium]
MKASLFEKLMVSRKKRLQRLKNNVVKYLSSLSENELKEDQKQVLQFLTKNDIAVFPYEFTRKYNPTDIPLFYDTARKLLYTPWEGGNLYYKNGTQKEKAQRYFNSLRLEQDILSPHRYLTEDFNVLENDVIVDVGAAEGNFSLSVIEKAKHIYLFEPEKDWVKALEATFAPWKHKVTIIQKFISDKTSDNSITLDDYFNKNQLINFIKADVEGAEGSLLRGATNLIQRHKNLKIAVTTYHSQEDALLLESIVKEAGFTASFSDGYMLFYYGKENVVKEPYLRKAVLRAVKKIG